MLKTVYLHNDFEFEVRVTTHDNTTGRVIAATGLTDLSYWFSLTRGGSAIPGTLVTLLERTGNPGTYYSILDAVALDIALTVYQRQRIYGVVGRSGDVVTYTAYQIKAVRPAA